MGNKLCKKKVEVIDAPTKSPFDRIITRLHLRPNTWKSESQLNKKEVNRYEVNAKNNTKSGTANLRPLSNSKSSDWTDATLVVPNNNEPVHLRNPKLELIFNDDSTPVPPPRKHKRGLREKLESVAKSGLQAFQNKKPVEEPLFTKKTVDPTCPLDDHDCATHNVTHKHDKNTPKSLRKIDKQNKRRKNLSVVSLPNYSELKFSIANIDDDLDKKPQRNSLHNSALSLPGESKKLSAVSTGKLESYMIRCRSFGSLLPQQLLDKLKVPKIPADVESDDSFGGLEDWDLRILEHYNPRDTSLPRQRKPLKKSNDVVSDVESLIIKDDELDRPVPPVRRSESLLKKLNREASENAAKRKSSELIENNKDTKGDSPRSITPPPSPAVDDQKDTKKTIVELPTKDPSGNVEHSTLIKILEEYSMRDKQKENETEKEKENERLPRIVDAKKATTEEKIEVKTEKKLSDSNFSSLTPSLLEFEKSLSNTVEDFINTEKSHMMKDPHFNKFTNRNLSLTTELTKT